MDEYENPYLSGSYSTSGGFNGLVTSVDEYCEVNHDDNSSKDYIDEEEINSYDGPRLWGFYHGLMDRKEAVDILATRSVPGSYIARKSNKKPELILSIFVVKGDVRHYTITVVDGYCYFGSMRFNSWAKLTGYFNKHPIIDTLCLSLPIYCRNKGIFVKSSKEFIHHSAFSFLKDSLFKTFDDLTSDSHLIECLAIGHSDETSLVMIPKSFVEATEEPPSSFACYNHGAISGETATQLLISQQQDGAFLIRLSSNKKDHTLMTIAKGVIKNYKITNAKDDPKKWILVGNAKQFHSVQSIIIYYMKTPIYETLTLSYPVIVPPALNNSVKEEELRVKLKEATIKAAATSFKDDTSKQYSSNTSSITQHSDHLLRRDHKTGKWKQCFISIDNNYKLRIYYDPNKIHKSPDKIIDLAKAHVSDMHISFFGRIGCFQIVDLVGLSISTRKGSAADSYHYFCCDNTNMRDKNVYILNQAKNPTKYNDMMDPEVKSFIHNLKLSFKQVKGVSSKIKTIYATISIDSYPRARTLENQENIQRQGQYNFAEEFSFREVNIERNVKLDFFSPKSSPSSSKEMYIGTAHINLDDHANKNAEAWFSFVDDSSSDSKTSFTPGTQILLEISFHKYTIHPLSAYRGLAGLVFQDNYRIIRELNDKLPTPERDELAKSLFAIHSYSDSYTILTLLKHLCKQTIENTTHPSTLFRGNNLFSRTIDLLLKSLGSTYLATTLQPTLNLVCACKIDLDVLDNNSSGSSPGLMESGSSHSFSKSSMEIVSSSSKKVGMDKNKPEKIKTTQMYFNTLWKNIQDSLTELPMVLRLIFSYIREEVSHKFKDNQQQIVYQSIGMFAFLRFFCLAILTPRLFNLSMDTTNENSEKNLKVIAKLFQTLLRSESELKESNNAFSTFILEQKPAMDKYLTKLSNVPLSQESTLKPNVTDLKVLQLSLATLHYILFNLLKQDKKSIVDRNSPAWQNLIVEMEIIEVRDK